MVMQDSAEQEVRPTGTTRPRERSLAELGGNRSAKPGAPHLSLNTPSPVVAVDQSGICFSVFFCQGWDKKGPSEPSEIREQTTSRVDLHSVSFHYEE